MERYLGPSTLAKLQEVEAVEDEFEEDKEAVIAEVVEDEEEDEAEEVVASIEELAEAEEAAEESSEEVQENA